MSLRPIDIRLLLPNVTVQHVVVVARMAAGMEHADANLLARGSSEHRSDRIAADLAFVSTFVKSNSRVFSSGVFGAKPMRFQSGSVR